MFFSVINFFRGYLKIKASGNFTERFINLAIKSNIYLWEIKKISETEAEMCISLRGFQKIRSAAFKTKTRVKIISRHGFPMFLHKHRKRKAFYIGFAVFTAILIYLTSFIWSVEITGNEITDKDEILKELKTCGIYSGVVKYGHSSHKIQDEMMEKVPRLSWIWVEIKGTRAIVSVKERTQKPDIFDKNTPCNIVAKKDGVIINTTVRNGIQVVNPGDVVKKGDLLVSGVADSKADGIRFLNSDGEIYADTWYEKTKTFPMNRVYSERTGESKKKISLKAWNAEIPLLPIGKTGYGTFEEELWEKKLKLWGDLYLPFIVKGGTIYETSEKLVKLNEKEATDYYGNIVLEEIKKGLPKECEVADKEIIHTAENNKITITVILKCKENIAEKTAIEVGG